jgi:hypothetical protein
MILIRIMVQQPKLAFIMESTLILIQSMMCQNIYSRFVMHETKVHYIIMGILTRLISMSFYSQNVDHLDLLHVTHNFFNKHEIFSSKN